MFRRYTTTTAKTKLLEQAIKQVPEFGFTKQSIINSTKSLGWTDSAHAICQPFDLVEYFISTSTDRLKEFPLQQVKTTAKIKELVMHRLEMTQPLVHYWPQALQLMASPQNSMTSIKLLQELVDEIWYLAGDQSIDLNWYSKRVLLAGVYTSTELFMVNDRSLQFQDTEMFLDRRLRDVGVLGRGFSNAVGVVQFQASQVCSVLNSKLK
jgi:ubiquinone biosynthesis protein COQ9